MPGRLGCTRHLPRCWRGGDLRRLDVAIGARAGHFFSLVKGEAHARLVIGYPDTATKTDVEAHLASCVDLFLRAFAGRREAG